MNIVEIINSAVRPFVTVVFSVAVVYGFVVGAISGDTFMAVVSMVIGFWFRDRLEIKKGEDPTE